MAHALNVALPERWRVTRNGELWREGIIPLSDGNQAYLLVPSVGHRKSALLACARFTPQRCNGARSPAGGYKGTGKKVWPDCLPGAKHQAQNGLFVAGSGLQKTDRDGQLVLPARAGDG